jgi:hypothetical protein
VIAEANHFGAYRYRVAGRGSPRVQRGGFASEQDAEDALQRELDRVRRERRIPRALTFSELVETYLAQHDVQPVTIEKLRWLLSKAVSVFGDRRVSELTSQEIAEWRMTLSPGYRFEATQALRQTLHRAVVWGMIDVNPAKVGVDNPTPRRKEQRPFEPWAELETVAAMLGRRYGPMIIFAAATGLRPAEWIALEKRDIDQEERVVYVRRSFTRREIKLPKTEASLRAVPLQARALDSNGYPRAQIRRCSFRVSAGATWTYTTSVPTSGGLPNSPPASIRFDGSTISGTPSRPSLSVPASPPSTCPATWAPA